MCVWWQAAARCDVVGAAGGVPVVRAAPSLDDHIHQRLQVQRGQTNRAVPHWSSL